MAARETGFGAVENLLHQGKLLALELLVRVLENPLHTWNHVRLEVCILPAKFCICLQGLNACWKEQHIAPCVHVRLLCFKFISKHVT